MKYQIQNPTPQSTINETITIPAIAPIDKPPSLVSAVAVAVEVALADADGVGASPTTVKVITVSCPLYLTVTSNCPAYLNS